MDSRDITGSDKKLFDFFLDIGTRKSLPDKLQLMELLDQTISACYQDSEISRPRDIEGNPGGIINLDKNLPVLIVPDIHGRSQLLISMLQYPVNGIPAFKLLAEGKLQVLCLGDVFHTEVGCQEHWLKAFEEYQNGFEWHDEMDREMVLNFRTMEILLQMKRLFGPAFHFLKGNHENINNDNLDGNYSFGKYAHEGEMVKHWCEMFYGIDTIEKMKTLEKLLPLLAIGDHFLASHAEPDDFYPPDAVINYRRNPDVVYGLTWTTNDRDRLASVWKMLDTYLDDQRGRSTLYFGGHRHISGRYHLRAGRRFVQIHNPDKYIIALIRPSVEIDLDRDIIELE
jgi:hypothetical protein